MKIYILKDGECGVEKVFKIIGNQWIPSILEKCFLRNGLTSSELRKEILACPETTFNRQLNNLVSNEMLVCKNEGEKAGSYVLTERAKDMMPILSLLQRLAYACDFPSSDYDNAMDFAKSLIGQKWKARIIWLIYSCGSMRFNSLQKSIEGISHKVLQEQLLALQQSDLVKKIDYNEQPPRTAYFLTAKGEIAYELIQEFADWAKKYGLIKVQIEISNLV